MAFYTRNQWLGLIDVTPNGTTRDYARVRFSEDFEIDEGTKTDSKEFVDTDSTTTTISGFEPKIEFENYCEPTDKIFKFVNKLQHEQDPMGRETTFMLCRPGEEHYAELYPVMVTEIKLNAPDQKFNYTLAPVGKCKVGTWTMGTDGVPMFAEDTKKAEDSSTSGNVKVES